MYLEQPKDRLKTARQRAGYDSPSSAAASIRAINKNTLISNENGNRAISRKMAEVYAKYFNVTAGWLLYGDREETTLLSVPLVSWVSAGQLEADEIKEPFYFEDFPQIMSVNLGPGEWIALRVDGSSMNKISPPDSIIFVNTSDTQLVPNALYVVADETGQATYKRYEPEKDPPFQPASYKTTSPPVFSGPVRVIGRVRKSMIET